MHVLWKSLCFDSMCRFQPNPFFEESRLEFSINIFMWDNTKPVAAQIDINSIQITSFTFSLL